MRKVALALVLLLAQLGLANAQQAFQGYTSAGFQQLTPTSATALTVPPGARWAWMCADTATVTWRDDGTAPTGAIGMVIVANGCIQYSGPLQTFQAFSATGHLNVSYYK